MIQSTCMLPAELILQYSTYIIKWSIWLFYDSFASFLKLQISSPHSLSLHGKEWILFKMLPFVYHRIKKRVRVNEWWQSFTDVTVSGLYLTSAVLIYMNVWFANTAQLELTADFLRLEQIFIFLSYSLYSNRGNCKQSPSEMHHSLYQGSLDYTLIFLCMNDSRVLRMKLLLALLISKYNLYGKICQSH